MDTIGNVIIEFNELKELIEGHRSEQRLIDNVRKLNLKLKTLVNEVRDIDGNYTAFNLFGDITTKPKDRVIEIKIDDRFRNLINNLIGNFTKFDLKDLISLNSTYSKTLFRLLKQWESKKEREFPMDEFRELLAIPPKYRISEIDKFVLTPIMTELPQYFFNLKLEKIKTGRRVTSLKFTWNGKQKEAIDIKEAEVVEIEISEQLNKAIEKAKKNRFIEKLLTLDNIEILTQMFQENDLVKGLLWAYKEVKQDISTLNYLIKTIRTGAEQKEIKIKVKENKNKEVIQEVLFDEKTDTFKVDPGKKEKISQEKYEELYKGYLKENNIAHNRGTRLGFDKLYENKYEIIETPKEKIYTINELPKEKLLSKAGKELKGMALLMRLRKIAEEMKVSIEYNSEIIKGV